MQIRQYRVAYNNIYLSRIAWIDDSILCGTFVKCKSIFLFILIPLLQCQVEIWDPLVSLLGRCGSNFIPLLIQHIVQ